MNQAMNKTSMLSSNHTCFLWIGIFQPEWWLARNGEIEEHIFQKMPAAIHGKNWLSIKSRGDLKTA
jgi:hypothetical protein